MSITTNPPIVMFNFQREYRYHRGAWRFVIVEWNYWSGYGRYTPKIVGEIK